MKTRREAVNYAGKPPSRRSCAVGAGCAAMLLRAGRSAECASTAARASPPAQQEIPLAAAHLPPQHRRAQRREQHRADLGDHVGLAEVVRVALHQHARPQVADGVGVQAAECAPARPGACCPGARRPAPARRCRRARCVRRVGVARRSGVPAAVTASARRGSSSSRPLVAELVAQQRAARVAAPARRRRPLRASRRRCGTRCPSAVASTRVSAWPLSAICRTSRSACTRPARASTRSSMHSCRRAPGVTCVCVADAVLQRGIGGGDHRAAEAFVAVDRAPATAPG